MKIAVAWMAIVLAGGAVGIRALREREAELLAQLFRGAERAAVAFDAGELQRLSATPADAGTAVYEEVKKRLHRFRAIDPRMRDMTLVRYLPDAGAAGGRLIVLADSRAPGAERAASPGSEYPLEPGASGLRAAVEQGVPLAEEPFTVEGETGIRGYALLDPAKKGSGPDTPKDILILTADASDWETDMLLAGLESAFLVWILLGLPLGLGLVMRRQSEQRDVIRNLSEAMEQSHSAIMIVDLGNRIEFANRGMCQQSGYSRREMIGRKWEEFHAAANAAETVSDLMATVRAGRSWEGEWLSQRKDGTVYPVRGVVTPVKQRDGSLSCYVAVFDDVTETKRREEELREARDLAQAGDRAKGQFLATMSHEVRTPLNGIVGFTSLLLETPLTPEQREYVQTIRMSTEALIQLTGDILDFARIESGKLKLDPLVCDPRACIEDAFDLLAAKAAEKGLELLHRIDADVPAAIMVDGGRLRQVLVNLVGNAVKFTERGEVEVTLALASEEEERAARSGVAAEAAAMDPAALVPVSAGQSIGGAACALVFTVRDTGIGIAPEHHEKLFRPFTQVDESTTRRYGGTGLGLAISRNLVELMGGGIRISSASDRGSTFTFTVRAPVVARHAPERRLPELKLGLAARPGPWRREMVELLRGWQATVIEADLAEDLAAESWDLALVEVGEDDARALAEQPPLAGLAPEKSFGLVPVTLSNELRSAMRAHFRQLVNRPVRHEMLFALLSGAQPNLPVPTPAARFGFHVLVVEDNAVNRRLVSKVLATLGCTSALVENGRQALEELSARAEKYDLVLLDLHMPELDGLSTLREIRAGNAGAHAQGMWVVALTADAREQQRASGMAAGLNDYLTKPLNLPELELALRRFRDERMGRA